ncbi:hypothetical protein TrVE_jg5127 [Triparma verrucosa]|uniref:Uncharacterized protein n=1 Tax=Triparma verrucosa TaxID=1606542 RepID=A0A9W7B6F3_9STRA|nr:hypothetical protein TrVE_jg5127 [Triparma verrucosa]
MTTVMMFHPSYFDNEAVLDWLAGLEPGNRIFNEVVEKRVKWYKRKSLHTLSTFFEVLSNLYHHYQKLPNVKCIVCQMDASYSVKKNPSKNSKNMLEKIKNLDACTDTLSLADTPRENVDDGFEIICYCGGCYAREGGEGGERVEKNKGRYYDRIKVILGRLEEGIRELDDLKMKGKT